MSTGTKLLQAHYAAKGSKLQQMLLEAGKAELAAAAAPPKIGQNGAGRRLLAKAAAEKAKRNGL